MNKLMIYLSMTAGLWLLMLPDSDGAYESTGQWFETESRCRYIGAKQGDRIWNKLLAVAYDVEYGAVFEKTYLCVESTPTE